MRWRRALPLGFLVLALSPASASAAIPTRTLTCGEVITESVRLANDLTCQDNFNTGFFGPALRVAADGVTLDLGGHTVIMASTLRSPGVVALGAHVTIRNGTVDAGGIAVELSGDYGRVVDLQGIGRNAISAGAPGDGIQVNSPLHQSGSQRRLLQRAARDQGRAGHDQRARQHRRRQR